MRFLASKAGTVHVVGRSPSDTGSCPAMTRLLNAGTWKGQRSLKPEEVLKMKDCEKCGSHKSARAVRRAAAKTVDQRPIPRIDSGPDNRPNNAAKAKRIAAKHPVGPTRPAKAAPVVLPGSQRADERTTTKAKEHADLAIEYGWAVVVEPNDVGGLTVTATKGEESCVLTYREGGYLDNPKIVFKVPGRTVPLHNSGTWRRQVSLPEGKRPVSARPKRAGRVTKPRDDSPESLEQPDGESLLAEEVIPLNKSALPFPLDADDAEITDLIKGRTLYWRNNMASKVASARVPSKPRLIRFGFAGRGGRRYVSFPESTMTKDGEMWGAERSVAIEDMLRVRD